MCLAKAGMQAGRWKERTRERKVVNKRVRDVQKHIHGGKKSA
jgi:hypothetical protein